MKKLLILFVLLCIVKYSFCQQTKDYKAIADSIEYVQEVPYMDNCTDSVLWRIVGEDLDIIPYLIDKIHDSQETEVNVLFFGGNYTIGDLAYLAIQGIIRGIPTFDLLCVEFDALGCGYCSYWYHLRKDTANRLRFQEKLRSWYEENKDSLVWVESRLSAIGDCVSPISGYYEVAK